MEPIDYRIVQYKRWYNLMKNVHLKPNNLRKVHGFFYQRFENEYMMIGGFILYYRKNLILIKSKKKKEEMAKKYLIVLSHLCERYNVSKIGQETDNLCLKILNPNEYTELNRALTKYKRKSKQYIDRIIEKLDNTLNGEITDYAIIGRYKNIYRIYQKTKNQPGRHLFKLKDIFAFRIIINNNSISDCYAVIKLLRNLYSELPDHFKDYIESPKTNGYQSIHLVLCKVIRNFDLPVEIQIRTKRMDDCTKRGICAHWVYKYEKESKLFTLNERKLTQKEFPIIKCDKNFDSNLVYCINDSGDVVILKNYNTALDYAYRLGEDVGNRISAIYVNGNRSPLDYVINNGDLIQIVSGSKIRVKAEWLRFVYKNYSKKMISNCFLDRRELLYAGKAQLK